MTVKCDWCGSEIPDGDKAFVLMVGIIEGHLLAGDNDPAVFVCKVCLAREWVRSGDWQAAARQEP